jgi:hypothetical protein
LKAASLLKRSKLPGRKMRLVGEKKMTHMTGTLGVATGAPGNGMEGVLLTGR